MMAVFKGPAMAAVAMLMFAAMGAFVKIAAASVPVAEVLVFRGMVGGIVVALLARHERISLIGNRTRLLFFRGLTGTAALFLFFYALSQLSVGSAILLNQTTPVFVLPLAAVFLKERITARHVALALIALVGVALVVRPRADMAFTPALLALCSAVFAAVAYVLIRNLSSTEHPLVIVFWFNMVSCLAAFPIAIPSLVVPSLDVIGVLLAMALLGTGGQVLITVAFRYAEAGRLTVVGSTGALFGAGFDYLLWDHFPDRFTALGGAIVILACTLIQIVGRGTRESHTPQRGAARYWGG